MGTHPDSCCRKDVYEQQGFAQEYIQALMGHADEKMTKHYQEGHDEKKIEYLEVGAELAF
ncbi:hypothetical protein [Pseudomonas costantinii]|uniref:Integrase n=1 Tax=Pseudomonas costantinii TaxID=168469 RepID=A0A1S2UQ39_9PSED|nr:hypothetical protein [Pseudomonas costantinii]NVZ21268.1 hypothetical protein [Pseudomonas costantinii]OIN48315.1 hypothetical protein BFL40_24250 [Pseudomonas costantinii]